MYPNEPSPWYEFELLKKGTGEGGSPTLFLHYKVIWCRGCSVSTRLTISSWCRMIVSGTTGRGRCVKQATCGASRRSPAGPMPIRIPNSDPLTHREVHFAA